MVVGEEENDRNLKYKKQDPEGGNVIILFNSSLVVVQDVARTKPIQRDEVRRMKSKPIVVVQDVALTKPIKRKDSKGFSVNSSR